MYIQLTCETCGKEFKRRKAEVNRSKKLGRRNYCSLQCVGKDNHTHLPANPENLIPDNKADDLSPFRFFMKILRNCKRKPFFITVEDLKKQWEKQNGKCPYTGWKLKTPKNTRESLPRTPDRASLDRIDSSKPYTKDNIQFVSLMAQYAKNTWDDQELKDFCEAVVNFNPS